MKKGIVGLVVLGLLAIGAVGLAGPKTVKSSSDGGEELGAQPRKVPAVIRLPGGPRVKRLPNNVNCGTLRCINKSLTKLNRATNALLFTTFTCEQLMAVSQYFGYRYDDGGGGDFPTTALDLTQVGEAPGALAVIDTCG